MKLIDNIRTALRRASKEKTRQAHMLLGLGFAAFVGAFFLLHLVLPDAKISQAEKRTLSQRPEISANSILSGRFSSSFEDYASDQMPFRGAFVRLKSTTDRLLGKKDANGVYRGKGGSLIEKVEKPDLVAMDETTTAMKKLAEQYQSEYTLVLFPNAATVDADRLPAFAENADQAVFSAEVGARFAGSPVRYMDLTGEMLALKASEGDVFYKTDHHWTTETAFGLAPAIMSGIGVGFEPSDWTPLTACDSFKGSLTAKSGYSTGAEDAITVYRPKEELNYLLSGSGIQGKIATVYSQEGLESNDPYTVFLGGNDGYVHVETDRVGYGHLLVFKNSYFNSFLPFLLGSYETIDVVDPRYFCEDLQSMLYQNAYDDVVFFYDMDTFARDTSLSLVLGELNFGE